MFEIWAENQGALVMVHILNIFFIQILITGSKKLKDPRNLLVLFTTDVVTISSFPQKNLRYMNTVYCYNGKNITLEIFPGFIEI